VSDALLLAAEGGAEGGFQAPGLGLFHWEPMFSVGGFDVTKPMLLSFVAAGLVLMFFAMAFARPKVVPRGMQNVGEIGYLFVRDQIARQVIGHNGDRYVPFLVSLFFFVWFMNLLAIVPLAQFPVTSRIAFPAVLAFIVWVTFLVVGIKNQGPIGYFKNIMFPPGLPVWLYPILAPIELVSTIFVRPFTLAVRLFANMFAGHLLIAIFAVAAWHFVVDEPGVMSLVGVLGFLTAVIMTGFELLIQGLQAFIFVLLTAVYISGSLEAEH